MSGTNGTSMPLEKNVTLTIDYTKSAWEVTLSSVVGSVIRLSNTAFFGWKNAETCVGGVDVTYFLNLTIPAYTLSASTTSHGTAGYDCNIKKFRIAPNVIINGTSLGNGQKIQIGEQIITISIQHILCSNYVCS